MEPSHTAAEMVPEPAAHPAHSSAQKENDVKQKKVNFSYSALLLFLAII